MIVDALGNRLEKGDFVAVSKSALKDLLIAQVAVADVHTIKGKSVIKLVIGIDWEFPSTMPRIDSVLKIQVGEQGKQPS